MCWLLNIFFIVVVSSSILAASFRFCHSPECLFTMRSCLHRRLLCRVLPSSLIKENKGSSSSRLHAKRYGDQLKMILAVRTDLAMTKGKIAAQCCHAALGAYKKASKAALCSWEDEGQAKVVVKVSTEDELLKLKMEARRRGLNTFLVHDAGKTQVAPNSMTVLAIGPDCVSAIDAVSGHLKLL